MSSPSAQDSGSMSPPRAPPAAQQPTSLRVGFTRETSESRSPVGRRSMSTSRSHSRARLLPFSKRSQSSPDRPEKKQLGFLQPQRDPRTLLPLFISRFLGYRSPEARKAPKGLIPGMNRLSQHHETLIFGWFGCFVGILLAEAVLIGSPLFTGFWTDTPLVIASLGAQAVLIFGLIESPLSQPRNVMGGQLISALTACIFVKLFQLSPYYVETTTTTQNSFTQVVWVNAALAMATAYAAMDLTGTMHPPGGATALIVCTTPPVTQLYFRFLLEVFATVAVNLGWACIINNLGRRSYPKTWIWTTPFPTEPDADEEKQAKEMSNMAPPKRGELGDVTEEDGDDATQRGRQPRKM